MTKPITPQELAEMRARCDAAKPGTQLYEDEASRMIVQDLPACLGEIERLQNETRLLRLRILKHISYSGSTNGDCAECGTESVELYDTIGGEICWSCVRNFVDKTKALAGEEAEK